MFGTEGDEPCVEAVEQLREQALTGTGDDKRGGVGREQDFDKIGHRERCGHGEEHRQHHKEPISRQTGDIRAHVVEGERHTSIRYEWSAKRGVRRDITCISPLFANHSPLIIE